MVNAAAVKLCLGVVVAGFCLLPMHGTEAGGYGGCKPGPKGPPGPPGKAGKKGPPGVCPLPTPKYETTTSKYYTTTPKYEPPTTKYETPPPKYTPGKRSVAEFAEVAHLRAARGGYENKCPAGPPGDVGQPGPPGPPGEPGKCQPPPEGYGYGPAEKGKEDYGGEKDKYEHHVRVARGGYKEESYKEEVGPPGPPGPAGPPGADGPPGACECKY